jgi:hypothetical protein
MVPHVVVPSTNLFSFISLFLTYFAWKIYGNTYRQVSSNIMHVAGDVILTQQIMMIIIPYILKNQFYWLKDNHMT